MASGPIRHLPNALTTLRLLAIPPFAILLARAGDGESVAAGVLFAAAAVTDWFDGYLARRFDIASRFGRLADPLADRLLIGCAVIILYLHDRIPLLVPLLVVGRDLLLIAGFGVVAERGYELSVIRLGKTATFILMAALALTMVTHRGAVIPAITLWVGIALSLAAAVVYAIGLRRPTRDH